MASAGGARGERSEPSMGLLPDGGFMWLYVALCGSMWLYVDMERRMAGKWGARGERSEPSMGLLPAA